MAARLTTPPILQISVGLFSPHQQLADPPAARQQPQSSVPAQASPALPHGAHQPCQQSPFVVIAELHNSRRLELLTDPLALLHVVDEHVLQANVLAVGVLASENTSTQASGASGPQRH